MYPNIGVRILGTLFNKLEKDESKRVTVLLQVLYKRTVLTINLLICSLSQWSQTVYHSLTLQFTIGSTIDKSSDYEKELN